MNVCPRQAVLASLKCTSITPCHLDCSVNTGDDESIDGKRDYAGEEGMEEHRCGWVRLGRLGRELECVKWSRGGDEMEVVYMSHNDLCGATMMAEGGVLCCIGVGTEWVGAVVMVRYT